MAFVPTHIPPPIITDGSITPSDLKISVQAGELLEGFPSDEWENEVDHAIEFAIPDELQVNLPALFVSLRPYTLETARFFDDVRRCTRELTPLNEKDRTSALHRIKGDVYRDHKRRCPGVDDGKLRNWARKFVLVVKIGLDDLGLAH